MKNLAPRKTEASPREVATIHNLAEIYTLLNYNKLLNKYFFFFIIIIHTQHCAHPSYLVLTVRSHY